MNNPYEQAKNLEKELTVDEFEAKTTNIIDGILVSNIKDSDFSLNNSNNREFYEGMLGARKMVSNGLYGEPELFAGPTGMRKPSYFETPEGILRWQLKRHEEHVDEVKKNYPDDWEALIPKESLDDVEEIRRLLKFIESNPGKKLEKDVYEKEVPQTENVQKKEKSEGEELFNHQIENNIHPRAKRLKEDLALAIRSITGMRNNFKLVKDELDSILFENGLEYAENEEVEISEEDREILEPILNFRKELDKWGTLNETNIADFRKRVLGYMRDAFGIEAQEPREGENYDAKNMRSVKVTETKNELLKLKVKKVFNPSFKINDQLFEYYKKWHTAKGREMENEWNILKEKVSRRELVKKIDEDRAWLKKYSFSKSVRPAIVEIYVCNS